MTGETHEKAERSKLAKWSRRGFIGAGVLAGGGLLIGIGVRPGNPIGALAPKVAAGAGEREALVLETLMSFKRAGASGVLTYHAPLAARLLNG